MQEQVVAERTAALVHTKGMEREGRPGAEQCRGEKEHGGRSGGRVLGKMWPKATMLEQRARGTRHNEDGEAVERD